MTPGRVGIVGAGQVGTMLGLALGEAGAEVVLADRDPGALEAALARGAALRGVGLGEAMRAETVILAIPVPEILAFLDRGAGDLAPGSLLLDTGSAKGSVVRAMARRVPRGVAAVGGHPMAGTERPGAAGADPSRLRGAPFALVPVRDDAVAVDRAAALVRATGSHPLVMDAEAHDRAVARLSHLPHLTAAALALAARGADRRLASTGFAGATRLAASDPAMVAGFLSANDGEVRRAADDLRRALDELVAAVERGPDAVRPLLATARAAVLEETG
ncbi:MAG TPA: prephenate dehydrogenase/arogenate dehydrogenase family protein [Actinomycetota bacterium]|nr:prephenate dehydrogenase/arogenate dehydrogenase family protein [Actinomycetota bacterium]